MPQYYAYAARDRTSYLAHHGVKGQKWGVRNYQNEDGSLTELGRKHRGLKDYSISNIPKNLKNAASKLGIKVKTKAKEKVAEAKTKAAEKNAPKEGVTRTDYSKKELANLTDTELRNVLNRIQMENQYEQYSKQTLSSAKNTKKFEVGKTFVGQAVGFVGNAVLKSVGKRVEKNIDSWINPQKKKQDGNKTKTISQLSKMKQQDMTVGQYEQLKRYKKSKSESSQASTYTPSYDDNKPIEAVKIGGEITNAIFGDQDW